MEYDQPLYEAQNETCERYQCEKNKKNDFIFAQSGVFCAT